VVSLSQYHRPGRSARDAPARSARGAPGRSARDIARQIEGQVREGRLHPGDALPTVRGLASQLGVSPGTVAAAYSELRRRGLVSGAGRAGTRVRPAPPIAVRLPMTVPPGVRDLRSGGPDPALLPALPPVTRPARLYGLPPVSPPLAKVATRRLTPEGIDPRWLAVVGGALDGVERVLGAWLQPGDHVAVEDPGYSSVLDLLRALGLEAVPVPVDEAGATPAGLRAALERGAQAAVLTPRAQNPTGAAWDGARARQLRSVLHLHPDVLLVEDDHAGPAAGAPPMTLAEGCRRWTTIRSVSKWLGPDLRLAVLAGDETTVSRVEGRQVVGTGWVSYLLQDCVAALWGAPSTVRLLDRAAATYARRRRALMDALTAEGFAPSGSSGLTTWVPVSDEHAVVSGLLQRGWAVSPGEPFRVVSPPGIRIAFATLKEPEAVELARALTACLHLRPVRTG
jgi:DNA-binding transcriptional MocR family regulator